MHVELGTCTLRHGERVTAAMIVAPDPDWADAIEAMLQHKGPPWTWQNRALLREPTGVGARFFVLHRGNVPFSNLMIVDHGGVGLLGHVWTAETDRRGGASSILMELALSDFRERGGRALYLGTDFESAAWHYYRRRGFKPVADDSGYMAWTAEPRDAFENAWFASGDLIVEPLGWPHWPAAAPLFLLEAGGQIRIAATGLFGRMSSEGPLLPLLAAGSAPTRTCVLRQPETAAVHGLASVQPHPLWPHTALVDVHCHPAAWNAAPRLLDAAVPDAVGRCVAYADAGQPERQAALEAAGFRRSADLREWLPTGGVSTNRIDVIVFNRG